MMEGQGLRATCGSTGKVAVRQLGTLSGDVSEEGEVVRARSWLGYFLVGGKSKFQGPERKRSHVRNGRKEARRLQDQGALSSVRSGGRGHSQMVRRIGFPFKCHQSHWRVLRRGIP